MRLRRFYLSVLILLSSSGLLAQNVLGKWKSIDDETGKPKSVVEIYKKGDVYEGKIVKLFRSADQDQNPKCKECDQNDPRYNQPIIGMVIIQDMEFENGALDDGNILDPENGEVYDCKIWVREDGKLNVRGYVLFLYRTQTWLPYDE